MKKILPNNHKKGFTLIELLVVVAIIATLAVLVFVALNPGERLRDARDARRISDVSSILTAIHESIIDSAGGTQPTNMPPVDSLRGIGTGTACDISASPDCTITETACQNLMLGAQNLTAYLASMPISPLDGTNTFTAAETGYAVKRDANGIVTITACGTEGTPTVQAAR